MNIPDQIKELAAQFKTAGFSLYLVGGSLRDLLLGKEAKDWDFTTDAQPEDTLKVLQGFSEHSSQKGSIYGRPFYNNKFGTVGVTTELGILEITTMRKEGDYKDHRHPSVIGWTDKIEEDLARRDFTMNAIALKVESNGEIKLIDPFNGQHDLQNKVIKTVGDPSNRFQEDALRIMRAIRFSAQLNFNIEEQTLKAITENSNLLKEIAWERIRDELFKLLATDNAYQGIVTLQETGILEIILPELTRCFGIIQEGPKHDRVYDIGEHSFLSLKFCASSDPLVRFATLLHDIGKPDTHKIAPDGNVTFYNHDLVGGQVVKEISRRFNLSKEQTDKVYRLVRWHMFTISEGQTDSAIRRFIKNVGLENVDDMMALRVGDRLGGGTQKAVSWRMEKFRERIDEVMTKPFSITDLKVNGKDVMETLAIKPGPRVGEILNELFQEVLEDANKNTKEYLIERIKKTAPSNEA